MGQEVYTSVLVTKDYNLFKFMDGNRKINATNLSQIVNSMNDKQLVIPILVNQDYHIIDGQHRFTACKHLKKPVYYIIEEGYGIDDVIRANVNGGKKWTDFDYLNRYCELNDTTYLRIKDLLNEYALSINDFLVIYSFLRCKNYHAIKKMFRDGIIDLTTMDDIIQFLLCLEAFSEFKEYKKSKFISAFLRLYLHEDYDHEIMIKKMKSNFTFLERKSTIDDYIYLLCNKIYSYGKIKKPIYYDLNSKKFYTGK